MTTQDHRPDIRPPQSIETEQMILGAILKDPGAINEVVGIIDNETAFYSPNHKIIYRTILSLYAKAQPHDITVVAAELQKADTLEIVGNRSYLVELVEGVVTTANIAAHCEIVMGKALLRRLIATCNDVSGSCYAEDRPVIQILSECEEAIFNICEQRQDSAPKHISKILPKVLDRIEKLQSGAKIEGQVDIGFGDLDWLLKGEICPGNSVIIAGMPSHGKTQLALQMAESAAIGQGKAVLVFSLEMIDTKIGMRLIADQTHIDSQKMKSPGKIDTEDWQKIVDSQARLANADIWVDDRSVLTPLEILGTARQHATKHDLGLVIVDYLQLINPGTQGQSRHLEVAAISRHMKIMAKQLQVPVVTLSALRRDEEGRKPVLSRLRDSSALEYDADVVLFVWHSDDGAYIIVGKNKEGLRGEVQMNFHEGKWQQMSDRTPDGQEVML